MAESLSQNNYPGLLSALELNLSSMPDVAASDVADLLGKTTFTHNEKKYLYRAAEYAFNQRLSTVQLTAGSGDPITPGSANVDITLTFDNAVTITGSPQIGLTFDNANAQAATFFDGSGTTEIVFGYVTLADSNDIAAAGIATANANISLNGGTMLDAFGKVVGLEFTDPENFANVVAA